MGNSVDPYRPLSDPFTHELLRSRSTANGFVLYSTGPDRYDDGGKLPAMDEYNRDLVASY